MEEKSNDIQKWQLQKKEAIVENKVKKWKNGAKEKKSQQKMEF